jgi:hypothetical protein
MERKLVRLITVLILTFATCLLAVAGVTSASDVASACATVTTENPTPSEGCMDWMEGHLEPAVAEVDLDLQTIGNYSYWHVITEGAASVYDVPNGGVIRQIEPGFNFVIAVDTESTPDWIEIQGGGWMREEDIKYVQPSFFTGARLLQPLDTPIGWIMFNLYPASTPGGKQDYEHNPLMLKYDRFNIFASVTVDDILWYMIGPNQWLEQRWMAVAKPVARPEGVTGRWVAVDLYEQTLVAYEEDTPVFATLVATGLPNFDTREGIFNIWDRAILDPMSGAAGSPAAYALQSVPWVMYFDDGISLHGTYWHDGFGYRRSHGCVNLSISDARWIYEWTMENPPDDEGDPLTYVYVYSSGVYGQFGIAQG